ncbi:fasciclin domain-containing protein [Bacillus alkalicellulosilyticus]|uniref:fasciclin domain-containing protein n=1 Tax=Alkalihalobacterium alkalicellulosilyticum TaxID=1912214 RepID=UPI000997ECAD|nr:fasciclin domain-containing protein [Bacillus alkalicellulosilyticus]
MKKSKIFVMSLVFMLLMSMTMGALANEGEADIVDTAIAADDFNTLVAAVQAADLVDALKGEGPFTVFAPTDEAFATLLNDLGVTAEELLQSEDLANILLYHVVEGKVMSSDLSDGMEATTLNGETVTISLDPVRVNESNVVAADIEASNGVIHVIDAVLLPQGEEEAEEPAQADIVDTAVSAGMFNTLVAAVQAADLVDALKGEGPFTVFAPTDEAFAALLEELGLTAEELLESDDLASILLYHVVEGKVMSSDLSDGMEATTLNGETVTISLDPVRVNDANVVTADIEASNGVIHVIDAVLLPQGDEAAEPVEEEAPEETTEGSTPGGNEADEEEAATPAIPKTSNESILVYVLLSIISGGTLFYLLGRKKFSRA